MGNIYLGSAQPTGGGGTEINNQDIRVTENGEYTAEEGYTGLGTVIVSVSGGDTVQATNYTGTSITAGDKVFIKENAVISGSRAQVFIAGASSTNYYYLLNPTGTKVFWYNTSYDIASGTTTAVTYTPTDYFSGNQPVRYDSHGNMFVGYYLLGESPLELNVCCNQDDYAIPYSQNLQNFVLKKLDKSDFSTTQSWTVYTNGVAYPVSCVIGDKVYISASRSASGDRYIGTIDTQASEIYTSDRGDDYVVVYSTSDNALAICAKGGTYPIDNEKWSEIVLVNLDNNNELDNVFVSSNADLTALQGSSNNFVVFNRNTGVLCIGNNGNNDYYGVFKYNTTTKDFDTIAVVLTDYSTSEYKIMTASTDLSKIQLNNYLYTLSQLGGGYKALAYQPNLGSDVLTGIAGENAAVGATFNVTTILPQ